MKKETIAVSSLVPWSAIYVSDVNGSRATISLMSRWRLIGLVFPYLRQGSYSGFVIFQNDVDVIRPHFAGL